MRVLIEPPGFIGFPGGFFVRMPFHEKNILCALRVVIHFRGVQ